MHILLISDSFYPEISAQAARGFEHAREWVKLGHRVTVLTCAPNFPLGKLQAGYKNRIFQRETVEGIEICRVWSFMAPNKGFALRILDFLSFAASATLQCWRIPRPDVVIGTSPQLFTGVAAWLIARMRRVPFVFEVRDLWPEAIGQLGVMRGKPLMNALFHLARHLYRAAASIVTVGEGYARQLRDWHGIAAEKITVITNGVRPELFTPMGLRESVRARHGWCEDFVVMYLGTHGLSQKLGTVLEAAELLKDEPRIRFVLIGEGAEKEQLLRMREERGLTNCELWPAQPREDVPGLYEAADCCLVPLADNELFTGTYPSKIFEAMAMECPILLSVNGSSAELVERAKGGRTIPPQNPQAMAWALHEFYTNPALLATYRQGHARAFVLSEHSRESAAKRYITLLEKLV